MVHASPPSLGQKNCELSPDDIERICDAFMDFQETEQSKIFPNESFGYWKVTVDRPLRIEGIDPERAYKAKEIKELKEKGHRSEGGTASNQEDSRKGRRGQPLNVTGGDHN